MTGLYFLLAFLLTWTLQLPAVLAAQGWISGPPERYMMLVGLGGFGPAAAAMVTARVEGTGVRALLRPLGTWRVGVQWYLIALFLPGAIFVIAAGAYNALGHDEKIFYLPNMPAFVAAAVVFPLGEEIGWRGFALPRLIERIGPLTASVIIGVLWTFWHVPMLTLQGVSPELYFVFVPFMVGGSVFFTWLYGHTRGSLLLAVLAHVGAHLNNPGHAMPQRATPMMINTVAYVLLAAVLVLANRRAWDIGFERRPA
jgi:membrane protease YdiL (CAAX protease family)